MVFDDLKVRVSANTRDFEDGIESSRDELTQLTAQAASTSTGLAVLEDRAEETGDEMNRLDRATSGVTRSFGRLAGSAGVAGGALSTLSAITTATVIPAFLALSTVLAPLTVVLGGIAVAAGSLVAVFGGLVATGVVTHMQELKAALQEAKVEIIEIIQPLGEVFGPLLVDAVEALPGLVQAVVDSLGPLDQFRDTLIRLGETARTVIPRITGAMFNIAEEALPTLNSALSALTQQGPGVFQELQSVFIEVFPLVVNLSNAVADLTPELLDMGTAIANVVLPGMTKLVTVLDQLISRFNRLSPNLKSNLAIAIALAPAISAVATVLTTVSTPILAIVAALGSLGIAYKKNLFGFKTAVDTTIPSVAELKTTATDTFEAIVEILEKVDTAMQPITDATISLGKEMASASENIRQAFLPAFNNIQSTLRGAERPLRQFARAGRGALKGFIEFLETFVVPVIEFVFTEVIAPLVNTAVRAFGRNLNPVLRETADTIDALSSHANTFGNVMIRVWQEIEPVAMPFIDRLVEALESQLILAIDATADALMGLMNLIQGDWDAAADNFADSLDSILKSLKGIATFTSTTFENSIRGLADIYSDWILGGARFLKSQSGKAFTELKNGLKSFAGFIEDELKDALDLVGVMASAVGEIGEFFTTAISEIASDIQQFGTDIANEIIDAINEAIPNQLSINIPPIEVEGRTVVEGQTVSTSLPNNPIESAQTGGRIAQGGLLNVHEGERVVPAAQVEDRGPVEMGAQEIKLILEERTDIVNSRIEDGAEVVVKRRERRAKRNTGGTNGL